MQRFQKVYRAILIFTSMISSNIASASENEPTCSSIHTACSGAQEDLCYYIQRFIPVKIKLQSAIAEYNSPHTRSADTLKRNLNEIKDELFGQRGESDPAHIRYAGRVRNCVAAVRGAWNEHAQTCGVAFLRNNELNINDDPDLLEPMVIKNREFGVALLSVTNQSLEAATKTRIFTGLLRNAEEAISDDLKAILTQYKLDEMASIVEANGRRLSCQIPNTD